MSQPADQVPPGARRYDALAVVAIVLAVGTAVVYGFALMQQGGRPAPWFVAGLAVASMIGTYGAARSTPRRAVCLVGGGVIMVALGVVGIASIGGPVLVAGAILLVAAVRARSDGGTVVRAAGASEID